MRRWVWCRKCGHRKSQVYQDLSKICNIYSNLKSASTGTLSHKFKLELGKAFCIWFSMAATTTVRSPSHMSGRYGEKKETVRFFMYWIWEAMKFRGKQSMMGNVHIYEFLIVRKEQKYQERSCNSYKEKSIYMEELTDNVGLNDFTPL